MIIKLDLRFVEIDYELWALEEYLGALERQLPLLADQERTRTYARLRQEKVEDEAEVDFAFQELYELVENALPRFFRSPFLVTLWAIYESAVTEIADYLQKQQGRTLRMRDIRGNNFLDQAKKYFDRVLEFPLYTDNQTWERLNMLMTLRHIIAHSNGRIVAIKDEKIRNKIRGWEKSNIGISTFYGNLMLSEHFLRETYSIVSESLHDLLERVRSSVE